MLGGLFASDSSSAQSPRVELDDCALVDDEGHVGARGQRRDAAAVRIIRRKRDQICSTTLEVRFRRMVRTGSNFIGIPKEVR